MGGARMAKIEIKEPGWHDSLCQLIERAREFYDDKTLAELLILEAKRVEAKANEAHRKANCNVRQFERR